MLFLAIYNAGCSEPLRSSKADPGTRGTFLRDPTNRLMLIFFAALAIVSILLFHFSPVRQSIREQGGTGPSATPYVREIIIPIPDPGPTGITVGPDGKVWFVASNPALLVAFDPSSNTFEWYQMPVRVKPQSSWGMAFDDKGRLWMTASEDGVVLSFDTSRRTFQKVGLPNPLSFPVGLRVDGNGYVWVAMLNGDGLARIDPSDGSVRIYDLKTPGSGPVDLWIDQRSYVWTTLSLVNRIAYLDPVTGTVQEVPIEAPVISPVGIYVERSSERVWFTEHGGSAVSLLDLRTGKVTRIPTLGAVASNVTLPYWIRPDQDGRLWINLHVGNRIAVLDPRTWTLIEYHLPKGRILEIVNAVGIAIAPDGSVWFTEWSDGRIGILYPRKPAFEVSVNVPELRVKRGESLSLTAQLTGRSELPLTIRVVSLPTSVSRWSRTELLSVYAVEKETVERLAGQTSVNIRLTFSGEVKPGEYVIGIAASDTFVTVTRLVRVEVLG